MISGVVDDFTALPTTFHGLPVLRTSGLPSDAIVASCSTSIAPSVALRALASAGCRDVLEFHEIVVAADGRVTAPWFVTQQLESWETRSADWCWLDGIMEDDESRRTLREVLAFRITGKSEYTARHEVRLDQQYFEDFLECRHEIFVDAGGFDGDTAEAFCRRYPDYQRVHFVEPSPKNLRRARARLAGLRDVVWHGVAVSDSHGDMLFDPDAGSASAFNAAGIARVKVSTIDALIDEPVTFIKMDLEGWEMRALLGSLNHLRADRPKLAVAVYHAADDFLNVARLARSIHPDYKVFLRHYTQGWSETVMYFV
jgi:FkbM family methyltransferase